VNLDLIAVVILILGIILTVYCLFRLMVSYRVITRYIDTHTPSGELIEGEETAQGSPQASP
jgi:hypothetical protein